MYPTQVKVHSYSSDSVKVTFRGVATTAEEEPLQGYKVRDSIRSKIYALETKCVNVQEQSIRKFRDTCSSVKEEFLVPTHSHWWVQSLHAI